MESELMLAMIQELKDKDFKKSMRGYNPIEVDMFLDRITEQVRLLGAEVSALQDRLARSQEQINHYKTMEETLRETLVSAQKNADELHENAKRRAEVVFARAEEQSRAMVARGAEEQARAQQRVEALSQHAELYRSRFLMLLEAQRRLLETSDLYEEPLAQPTVAPEVLGMAQGGAGQFAAAAQLAQTTGQPGAPLPVPLSGEAIPAQPSGMPQPAAAPHEHVQRAPQSEAHSLPDLFAASPLSQPTMVFPQMQPRAGVQTLEPISVSTPANVPLTPAPPLHGEQTLALDFDAPSPHLPPQVPNVERLPELDAVREPIRIEVETPVIPIVESPTHSGVVKSFSADIKPFAAELPPFSSDATMPGAPRPIAASIPRDQMMNELFRGDDDAFRPEA